jgi:hypothetical protein
VHWLRRPRRVPPCRRSVRNRMPVSLRGGGVN